MMKQLILFWNRTNLATRLTLIRISVVPVFMVFMYFDNFYARVMSLLIFIAAGITDLYDGAIARRTNTITAIGTFLDPLADKLMMSVAFISFVEHPETGVPAWMVICIISREFIITGLRSVAASQGKSIPADTYGKVKASFQVSAIIAILAIFSVNSMLSHFWSIRVGQWVYALDWRYVVGIILQKLPWWLMLVVTFLTLYSGASYLQKNWDVFTERRKVKR